MRIVRIADGAPVPFEIQAHNVFGSGGRARWLPDGRAIALALDESFAISADGARIAIARVELTSSVVVADHVAGALPPAH